MRTARRSSRPTGTRSNRTITPALTLTTLILLPLALSAPSQPHSKRATLIYDGSAVSGRTFDYIIAGGGLAGSVLASRLSEDSSKTVLVVEAGYNEENNPIVTQASNYQKAFDQWINWAYKTVPQTTADGKVQTMNSGRALGGSTAINGMAWSKPHDFQIDALEGLGNAGLNWASLQQYMLRAEKFSAPSSSQYAAGVTYTASCHGNNGPLGVQYDPDASPQDVERAFNQTIKNLGLPYVTDLTCGNPAGEAPIANTRSGQTRNDAYRAYLWQQNRPNLTILSGANVGKVILSSGSSPRATGIEFRDEKGNTYTASGSREVIMALGSLKTPLILQYSGIGPADVLSAAGVQQRVDLPVGLNLIDQTTTTTDWNFSGSRGGGQPITFPRFNDLVKGGDADRLRGMLQNDIGSYVQDSVSSGSVSSAQKAGLQKVLEIQRDWILNKNAGMSENFDYTYSNVLGYDSWFLLNFGRGSVKIRDAQPYGNNFAINPRYFANPFDKLAQGATARFTRTASSTAPLSQFVTGETVPAGGVSSGNSLDDWANWSVQNYRSNWHPIGTAPMMSKDLGGAVDSRYKTYGVAGLRIVDASVLPFQVSSHLMSVMYGLAERAADIIKQDNSGPTPSSSSSVSSASSTASRSSSSSASRSSSSATPPSSTSRPIHPASAPSKCLDVVDGNLSNGALVQIWDCNGKPQQQWTITQGSAYTAVRVAGTNFCLDAGSGSPADGTRMKIWTCYDRTPAQSWVYNGDNTIQLLSKAECLDLTGGGTGNGNGVQVWGCSSGNVNQKWTV